MGEKDRGSKVLLPSGEPSPAYLSLYIRRLSLLYSRCIMVQQYILKKGVGSRRRVWGLSSLYHRRVVRRYLSCPLELYCGAEPIIGSRAPANTMYRVLSGARVHAPIQPSSLIRFYFSLYRYTLYIFLDPTYFLYHSL